MQESSPTDKTSNTRSNGEGSRRSRKWCFTLNNYEQKDLDNCSHLVPDHAKYLVYGKEVAPSTGTPHLQGFIYLNQAMSMKSVKKLFTSQTIHLEIARGSFSDNITYCTKDGDFMEFGQRPLDPAQKGEKEKERWKKARLSAVSGEFENVDDELYIRYVKNLEWIHKASLIQQSFEGTGDLDQRNLWLYGPTGSGKSYTAHKLAELMCSQPYLKMLNKWWDGYTKQKVVIIEEIDPEAGKFLASLMKKWLDKWAFTAECKGSVAKQIRPEHVIICSNYSIDACFMNSEDVRAIKRRCKCIALTDPVKPGSKDAEKFISELYEQMVSVTATVNI